MCYWKIKKIQGGKKDEWKNLEMPAELILPCSVDAVKNILAATKCKSTPECHG